MAYGYISVQIHMCFVHVWCSYVCIYEFKYMYVCLHVCAGQRLTLFFLNYFPSCFLTQVVSLNLEFICLPRLCDQLTLGALVSAFLVLGYKPLYPADFVGAGITHLGKVIAQ